MSYEFAGGLAAWITAPVGRRGRPLAALADQRARSGVPPEAGLVGRVYLEEGLTELGPGPVDLLVGRGRLWVASARKGGPAVGIGAEKVDSVIVYHAQLSLFLTDLERMTTREIHFTAVSKLAAAAGVRHVATMRDQLEALLGRQARRATAEVKRCTSCGASVPRYDERCPYCGAPQ